MLERSPELLRLLLLAMTGLIVIAGVTIDLYLVFLFQRRPSSLAFQAQDELRRRPFTFFHALLVLSVTLLFAVPALFQEPDAPTPSESMLICGPLLYALMSLLVISVCLALTGRSFRHAFTSTRCTTGQALRKGVLYGLAAIPPVMLLSHMMAACTEALGYTPRLQEVFDWLNDGAVSPGTRAFMMAVAILIAPVAEEVLFRGVLFPSLLKYRPFATAALLSSFYFALVHFHAPSLLPLMALSLAFSAAYTETGSLLTPIVMHALFNTTSLLLYLSGTE